MWTGETGWLDRRCSTLKGSQMPDIARVPPADEEPAPAGQPDVVVRRHEDHGRYEIEVDGRLVGFADFVEQGQGPGSVVVFPHTVIDPAHRGEGLGAQLVQAALDDMRSRGRLVAPACWYVREFIGSNPAYQDLLAA